MNLSNKTILITGGGTGIGLSFVKALNTDGNTIIICGRRQEKLDKAAADNPGVVGIQCDITDSDQVQAMLDTIATEHGGLDVLMNNAGIYNEFNFATAEGVPELVAREITINLIGPIQLISRALPQLMDNNGAVINITSGLAYVPFAPAPVYCATKAAMHFFSHTLRTQLADSPVTVIEILPPVVDTEMVAHMPEGGPIPKMNSDEMVKQALVALRKGKTEIPVGMAKQLRVMGRLAPGFIEAQLAKGSE